MGLNTPDDANSIEQTGRLLVTAVQLGSLKTVNGVLQQSHGVFFSNHADLALKLACTGLSKEKMVGMLLDNPAFLNSLSYCGLILARETAMKSENEEVSLKIAEVLDKRENQIREKGIFGYLEQIRSRTIWSATGEEQTFGPTADVIAFAIENSDMLALIALARKGAHKFLDEAAWNFIRERIEKKRVDPVTKETLRFVIDKMVDQRETDALLKSIETNASSIKDSVSSLIRSEKRKEKESKVSLLG